MESHYENYMIKIQLQNYGYASFVFIVFALESFRNGIFLYYPGCSQGMLHVSLPSRKNFRDTMPDQLRHF